MSRVGHRLDSAQQELLPIVEKRDNQPTSEQELITMAQHTIPTTVGSASETPRTWLLRIFRFARITATARRPHMALDEQKDHAPYFAQPSDQWRRILLALQQH